MDTHGAHDLGSFSKLSDEEREALAAQAQDTGTKPVVTAFVVVINPDGSAVGYTDPNVLTNYDAQPASLHQVAAGCHGVLDDLAASRTANVVLRSMQQQAMAAMEQAQNQKAWAQAQNGHRG